MYCGCVMRGGGCIVGVMRGGGCIMRGGGCFVVY